MTARMRTLGLLAAALGIAAWVLFGPRDFDTVEARQAAAPRVRGNTAHPSVGPASSTAPAVGAAPRVRAADAAAAGALFAVHSWYVAPPAPPPGPAVTPVAAPPPQPVAPPLPFRFIGSYQPDGEAPVFFLSRGDRVYDVHVGDTLDGIYSVDSFGNGQLVLTYKPLKTKQQLLTGGPP